MILLLLACAEPTPLPPAAPVWLERRKVESGAAAVLHAPEGTVIPSVEGLTITPDKTAWRITGPDGSYILDVPLGSTTVPVYLDIGVDGPTGGPLADLAEPPPKPLPVWPWIVAGVLALIALVAGVLYAWKRMRPVPPPPPPDPAWVVALRDWDQLRTRELAAAELAFGLSAVYRRYLDATRVWPATQRTSREILDNLAGELTASELDCARRLLSAMDLVRFADRGAHAELFEQLDRDFRGLIQGERRV